jgi:diadenosine tetraphosphate (Ap4A) HIT family hydrolase
MSNNIDCPICSWSPDNPNYSFVYESNLWRVVLAPNQWLVGRCVVHLKRHSGDLADLTQEELIEWLTVVRTLEAALRSAFGAALFNWSCYMNHAYREPVPNPHIHWWAVPRYDHQVTIGDRVFEDPDFGNPYDHYRWLEVPGEIRQQIVERIQREIS